MKFEQPSLTDVMRRAYEACDFFNLSASDKELLVFGIIRVWNDRRRPSRFPCKQVLLLGFAGMKEGSLKKSRRKLSELNLINWEEGERNVRSASYALGSWFFDDHECIHESTLENNSGCGRESAPYNRERDRDRDRDKTPIVPKGTRWAPDETQKKINSLFRRKDSTPWSDKELRTYKKLNIDAEDLELICNYYASRIDKKEDFRRRDISTLLNNWAGEVDRARAYCDPPTQDKFADGF